MNLRDPDQENTDILTKLWNDQNEVAKFEDQIKNQKEADLTNSENVKALTMAFLQSVSEQMGSISSKAVSSFRLMHCHNELLKKEGIKPPYPPEMVQEVRKLFDAVRNVVNCLDREAINKFASAERNTVDEKTTIEE